jgi:uncharacterized protein with HEPN domain
MSRDEAALFDVVRAAQQVADFVAGQDRQAFHEYDEVDLDQVWSTVIRDAPALLSYVESIVSEEER